MTGFLIDRSADGRTGWSTYRIAGAGTTSITGTDAQARPWFRIRTQFRADTAVTVGGATLRFAMSAASAPVRVGEALAASGPTLRVDDATAREGTDPAMLFNVRLAPAATTTVTVDYATEDASARAGDDYTATSGTLSFAPGETRKTVSVPITDDTTEDTGETFRMRLSNAQGATIADGAATGTIWNEDHTLDRLTLADASSGTDLATLADGVSIMLANTTNGRYNVRADLTAGATADSVQLALAGVRTAHRADTGAPYTLFSDAGENLGPGSYTVVATAYRAGTALHTISTTFRVVGPNGDTGPTHPLAASLPASAATASAHTGTDGRPEVIVAFNQSVAAIAADTPSVTVAGGTLDAVRRHTEAGSANLWAFAIDPDGNGDVTFTLAAGHGCASGGICTPEGTTLSMVLARPLVIPGPSDEPAVPATLSASFTGMPEEHDTNTPFTFNVTFSEAPQVARITMKRHVWDITNGAVTEAVPTDDRSTREWRVTVRPTGASDVTIALKTTTDCAASGALCTSAGLALADPPVAVIAAAADPPTRGPLTATFGRMPAEHGGPGAGFHFDLTFSENVKTGWRKIRFWAFQVGGGTFTRVARKHPGSNIAWTISAKPNTWGDMVVTLPGGRACGQANAICTFDGERLSNTATHTIMAPASLAVADATANENDDEGLRFVVSLSRSSDLRITVDYATSDGTAAAGTDYTATSGRLTFDPGETAKTVTVALLDDAVDDGGETLTLTLSNATNARIADATATGTIENSDPLQQAWIARFGRTVANDIVDGITDRLANRDSGSQVRIAGVTLRPNGSEWTEAPIEDTEPGDGLEGHRPIETRRISTREVLAQSAFRLSGQSDAPDGAAWGAWGRFSTSSFDGETNGLTLSGDVVTGVLGADLGTEDWTVGIALSSARGDGPYKMDNDDDRPGCHSGNVDSTLTSVHPYAQVQLNPAIALWGTAGYGTGEMTVDQDRCASYKTGIDMTMAAAGLRGQILEAAAGDGFDMAVRTDALWLRTMSDEIRDLARAEADVTRLRLTIDAGRSFSAGAGTITPSLEARVRHDAGDAEEGVGFEIGAGLAYRGPGITIEGNARTLVAHDDADYREWGASGAVRIDPGTSGRGLSLTITPTWGRAASDAEQLWSTRTAEDLVGDTEFEATRRLDAEFGYGLAGPLGFGTVTPYAGVALGDGAERTLKAGARWAASHSATVVLEALRAQSGTDTAAGNAVTLRAQVRF